MSTLEKRQSQLEGTPWREPNDIADAKEQEFSCSEKISEVEAQLRDPCRRSTFLSEEDYLNWRNDAARARDEFQILRQRLRFWVAGANREEAKRLASEKANRPDDPKPSARESHDAREVKRISRLAKSVKASDLVVKVSKFLARMRYLEAVHDAANALCDDPTAENLSDLAALLHLGESNPDLPETKA